MNTIKFAPYNELTAEQHNLETSVIKDGYYYPLNLNIFVTHACQCSCFFCFDRHNRNLIFDKDDAYYRGLINSIEYLQDLELLTEFTLTGGEPTFNPERFVKTLEILKKYEVKERTISTNGLNLLTKYKGKPLIQYLADFGFTHNISISRIDFEEKFNTENMRGPTISNEKLRKIAIFAEYNDIDLRVSIPFIKGAVENISDVIVNVSRFNKIGIKSLLFRELQGGSSFGIKINKEMDILKKELNNFFKFYKRIKNVFYIVDIFFYEKDGIKYIVKCYSDLPQDKKIINNLSYDGGILREGFNGKEIKSWK